MSVHIVGHRVRGHRALRLAWACLGVGVASPVSAQAVFEDTKGRTAMLLHQSRGVVGLNTADSSLQLGYFRLYNTESVLAGATLRGKATDGAASVFGKGGVGPDVGANLTIGYVPSGQTVLAVRWRRDWASASVIDSSAVPVPRLAKSTTSTWEIAGHVQVAAPRPGSWSWFLAVAAGNRRINNYGDLKKASVRVLREGTAADGSVVILEQQTEGRIGPLTTEVIGFADLDFLIAPRTSFPISMRVYGRGILGREDGAPHRNLGGFDVGLHKVGGDPLLDRVVALVVQVHEVRPGDESHAITDRTSVSFVANLAPILGRLWNAVSQ